MNELLELYRNQGKLHKKYAYKVYFFDWDECNIEQMIVKLKDALFRKLTIRGSNKGFHPIESAL